MICFFEDRLNISIYPVELQESLECERKNHKSWRCWKACLGHLSQRSTFSASYCNTLATQLAEGLSILHLLFSFLWLMLICWLGNLLMDSSLWAYFWICFFMLCLYIRREMHQPEYISYIQ